VRLKVRGKKFLASNLELALWNQEVGSMGWVLEE
jgi:hypothetical protein